MKTIGITGGSGFVGSHLTDKLVALGHQVIIFTRSTIRKPKRPQIRYSLWDPSSGKCDLRLLQEIDAVVNLAGEAIADKRWTDKRKKEIEDSRVRSTTFLVQRLKDHAPRCKTFISASAIGYYGPDRPGMTPFREEAEPYPDFLGTVCQEWEAAAHLADAFERTVILRFGLVLGRDGGVFPMLSRPVSFGIVPVLGKGSQMTSWIHVDDLSDIIIRTIEKEELRGVYNAVAPEAVPHRRLMKAIAERKSRLHLTIPVPEAALKLALGEASQEILKSCTVSADKIQGTGFSFRYGQLDQAVAQLCD